MAIMSGLSSILNTGSIGSGWQPKSSRIRVGRDVGALTATTFTGKTDRNTVVGNGDDVALKSKDIFNQIKSRAQKGFGVRQFRTITDKDLEDGSLNGGGVVRKSGDYKAMFFANTLKVEKGGYTATIQDGTITITKKNEEEGRPSILVMEAAITEDARLVWNGNGEPELLTGNAARTKGVLQARSENEIILSLSGSDVVAGEGTVVFNLSGKTGTYSGGNNVTYLGTYEGGEFTDTDGRVTFDGYFNRASFSGISGIAEFSGVFEEASVALGEGHGTFSGYFSASEILGAAINTMSGMFLNACTVRGGDGDDRFTGRFIGSEVDGGEGDNSFGYGKLNMMRKLTGSVTIDETTYQQNYMGVEADFINSAVTAGSGKDRVSGVAWGGSFDLGDGDDSTDGIFSGTVVNGGGGNDTLRADYSADAAFDAGEGDDTITLITAMTSSVITGEGNNTVTMGLNNVSSPAMTWQTSEEYLHRERPRETGELAYNTIDASRGDNAVTINNGETSRRIVARDRQTGNESGAGEAGIPGGENETAAPAMPEEGMAPNAQRAMNTAIGRYREILGLEPQNKGETAATVDFGNNITQSFAGTEREDTRNNREETGIIQSIRRYNADGTISWKRWQWLGEVAIG